MKTLTLIFLLFAAPAFAQHRTDSLPHKFIPKPFVAKPVAPRHQFVRDTSKHYTAPVRGKVNVDSMHRAHPEIDWGYKHRASADSSREAFLKLHGLDSTTLIQRGIRKPWNVSSADWKHHHNPPPKKP